MIASRALLEAFKFLRLQEITKGADLVSKHWHETAEKGELWAFLLEQELLVNRLSPMCQQDYPSLASRYISSRSAFIDFWCGAKQPEFLLLNTPEITLLALPTLQKISTSLVFCDGFRAVATGRGTVIVTGFRRDGNYTVLEYHAKSNIVTLLPCCSTHRSFHAVAADSENIYMTGGQADGRTLGSAEAYFNGEWRALPDMNFPTAYHTMVLINSRLFTFGGCHDKAELFDSGEWRSLDLFLPWALADFGVAVASFRQVLLVGGEARCGFGNYICSLDLMTGEVVKLVKTPLFRCHQNAVYFANQKVFAVSAEGKVLTFQCPLQFRVTVKCVHEGVQLKANLKVKPSYTVGMLTRKFQEIVSKTRHLQLLMFVNGFFVSDDLSVVSADITEGCQVELIESQRGQD